MIINLIRTVRPALPPTLSPLFCGLFAGITMTVSTQAQDIAVGNSSFESPSTPPGVRGFPFVDIWQKTPQPDWFDPALAGILWTQLAGVFPNTDPSKPNHIDNMAGDQAAYIFALPQVGLLQSSLNASFIVGRSYQLTVGLLGGGNIEEGDSLLVGLTYLDNANIPQSAATRVVPFHKSDFPTITHLIDVSVDLPEVKDTDAWSGKPIGVELISISGRGAGYWDIDNVRVSAVPEPSTLGILAVGATGLIAAARNTRRRR